MPAGDAFWLCHECRAEMRPIERNGSLTCASCGGEFIEILDEEVNPDPYYELPHPPTRPGQAPRSPSPNADDNPSFYQRMFDTLLGAQPGQQAPSGSRGRSAIPDLGSPAAMHGQRPPGGGQGRTFEFSTPGGGQGRVVFGSFGGSGGGGFMMGGGAGSSAGQGGNPFFPGFQIPPNPYRQNPPPPQHTRNYPGDMPMPPQDQLLRALMEMIADENDMAPQVLFGGMPGFGGPRGSSNLGDYVTTQQGFEDILERLMHAAGPQGPIPAADSVIDNLPRATFDEESLAASIYKDCPVCKDDFAVGDDYVRIPCAHIFHPDCLTPWLKQNGSCPVCRYSLVPEDGNRSADTPASATGSTSSTAPTGQEQSFGPNPHGPTHASAPQSPTEQPESFFTSILSRLWGQGGEARSATTETAPSVHRTSDELHLPGAMPSETSGPGGPSDSTPAQSARDARTAALASGIPLPASPALPATSEHAAEQQAPQSLYAGFQARTRSFNSTPTPDASRSGSNDGPPVPVLQNVSSAIPDDYRARHRQREREQERRNLPHDDLD